MNNCRNQRVRRHNGVTLIELLVVIVIALMISGAVLKAISPMLRGRQIREAARMVNVFINSSRNRAVLTGRPAGVWIDRMPNLNEACVSLSYAQVPDPYTGDFSDSGLESFIIGYPNIDPATMGVPGPQFFYNVVVPSSVSAGRNSAETWGYTDGSQKLIRQGDLLKVNLQGIPYRLFTIPETPFWVIGVGVNQGYLVNGKTRLGPGSAGMDGSLTGSRHYYIRWFNDLGLPITPYTTSGSSISRTGTPVPFQIIRQPMRGLGGSIQLPETTCIDLNYSGVYNTSSGEYRPFHPRLDPSDSAVPPDPYRGPAWDPTDLTPIIIMFSPSGTVEQVYCRYWMQGNSNSASPWVWRGDRIMSSLFLLIGKMEKLPATPAIDVTQAKMNWMDPENIWVSIRSATGSLVTDEVRLYQYNANGVTAPNYDPKSGLGTSLGGTIQGDTMGGR